MGKSKNAAIMQNSNKKSTNNKNPSIKRKKDFTAIPIPIENGTRPVLYSFFKGLKNVCKIRGIDKRFMQ